MVEFRNRPLSKQLVAVQVDGHPYGNAINEQSNHIRPGAAARRSSVRSFDLVSAYRQQRTEAGRSAAAVLVTRPQAPPAHHLFGVDKVGCRDIAKKQARRKARGALDNCTSSCTSLPKSASRATGLACHGHLPLRVDSSPIRSAADQHPKSRTRLPGSGSSRTILHAAKRSFSFPRLNRRFRHGLMKSGAVKSGLIGPWSDSAPPTQEPVRHGHFKLCACTRTPAGCAPPAETPCRSSQRTGTRPRIRANRGR